MRWRWLRRPVVKWPLAILAAAYGLFLLGVNVAINTGAIWSFLRPPDESSNIGWIWGWSVFPGFATVHGFHLTVQDENMQLAVLIDRAQVRFEIPAFLHKTFHATAVHAQGTSYRMRIKRENTPEEVARGLANQPPIPGYTDPPLRGPPPPPGDGDRSKFWTIHIENVHAETNDVWIEGTRFLGQSMAHGSFTLRPATVVEVNAGLTIQGGELFVDTNPLARSLRGELKIVVDRFDPQPEFGNMPLRHFVTDLTLDGEVQDVGLLNPVFNRVRAPEFGSSPGHFDVAVHFDHGSLMPGSRFAIQANRWVMTRGRYQAIGTDTYVEGTIDEGPHGLVQVSLGPYQVLDPQAGGEILEGDGMLLRMTSERFNLLDQPFSDLGFQVQLQSARVPDLMVLNAYLPNTSAFEVLGGSGELTGSFLRPANSIGEGDFRIDAHEVALRLQKLELRGDLGLKASVGGLASSASERRIAGPNQLAGEATLGGRLTVGALGETDPRKLAKLSTQAEIVLHPVLPAAVQGVDLIRYVSGELRLDGDIPGLEFLDEALRNRGVTVAGGAGQLRLDARVTHGVLGRATTFDYSSPRLAIQSGEYGGRGALVVEGRVDEGNATPRMRFVTGVHAAVVGSEALPDFLSIGDVSLTAESPEVDLWDVTAQRPDLKLVARQVVLPSLATLDRWLPEAVHFARGRATVGIDGHSPPEGTGRLDATVAVEGLDSKLGPAAVTGEVRGGAQLTGIAEQPWKADLLARSTVSGAAELDGRCHAVAGEHDTQSSAAIHFHATAALPPTPGDRLSANLATRATGNVGVTANITNLSYANQFLASSPVRLRGGSGDVRGEVKIADGTVAPGSTVAIDTHGLQASIGSFWLSGPLHASGTLGAPGASDRAHLQAALASFALTDRFERKLLAEGSGVSLDLSAPGFTGEALLVDSKFEGRAQQLTVPDLSSLTAYLPSTKALKLVSGSATASATLVHPSRDHGEAKVDLQVNHAAMLLSGKPFSSDMHLVAVLRALASAGSDGKPLLETLDVGDSEIDFSKVDFPSDRASDRDWWAKLRIVRGELGFPDESHNGVTLSGDATIEARDILPWLHLYGRGIGIPGLLDGLLAFNQLKATAALELRGNHFALPAFEAKGDHLKLEGRLRLDDQHTAGDFLLNLGPFAVGLDVRDKHAGVQLLGAGGWYQQRLKTPLE